MKKIIVLFGLLACCTQASAQRKNILKWSISDCVNCVSSFSYILKQDPAVTIVMQGEYAPDSLDVMEKFDLLPLRQQIVWNDSLYKALSTQSESELIQFCGNKEVNRSGLRRLKYVRVEGCSGD
jgi:hypothetical protein